ncbi:hypothetical protein [Sulfurimonas sp. ST-27]|uniref:hypothetical protein n=1 Tax=Sulfurimonas sp. ST-27 TaxID=3400152 RepID=UPI003AB37FFC
MKKIIISTISILLSTLLFNACSTAKISSEDVKTADFIHFKHEIPLKKVHTLIREAGEKNGWRITEFKENMLIGEKEENAKMKAVTITFAKNYFNISPKDADLQEAIKKEVEATEE